MSTAEIIGLIALLATLAFILSVMVGDYVRVKRRAHEREEYAERQAAFLLKQGEREDRRSESRSKPRSVDTGTRSRSSGDDVVTPVVVGAAVASGPSSAPGSCSGASSTFSSGGFDSCGGGF